MDAGIELSQKFQKKSDIICRVRKSQIFQQKSAEVRILHKMGISICGTTIDFTKERVSTLSDH